MKLFSSVAKEQSTFLRRASHRFLLTAFVALLSAPFIEPAHACRVTAPLQVSDVEHADVVLIGRVSNYRVIRDVEFRRKMLANPKLPPDLRKIYEGEGGLTVDYARFDIQVERLLAGEALSNVSAVWDNSVFLEPNQIDAGSMVIALRRQLSKTEFISGGSGGISLGEANPLIVLQAPCSPPFMFAIGSPEAREIERVLSATAE